MTDPLLALRDLLARGRRGVLATVVGTTGSTPGKDAMRLLLPEDGDPVGTVGGGAVEAQVLDAMRGVLGGEPGRLLSLDLTEEGAGLLCGGRIEILLQPVVDSPAWNAAAKAHAGGERAALVTRVDSGPLETALVPPDGTVRGDSDLARAASDAVDEAIRTDRPIRRVSPDGQGDLFVEPLGLPGLWIFGGGHVGLALARVAALAGFRVGVVDDRAEFANRERFPMAHETLAGPFPDVLERVSAGPGDAIVIVTRGHREDEAVLRWAVERPALSVGLIGSRRKIRSLFDRLAAEGVPGDALRRVRAPVGLDVGAETAEEIAVSIAAELIAVRRRGADDRETGRPLAFVRGPFAST